MTKPTEFTEDQITILANVTAMCQHKKGALLVTLARHMAKVLDNGKEPTEATARAVVGSLSTLSKEIGCYDHYAANVVEYLSMTMLVAEENLHIEKGKPQ